MSTPPPPPTGSSQSYQPEVYAQPPGTNGFAVASLVLGILWIFWVGSLLALVFGLIAKSQINASGGVQSGRGLAIAGIVLGCVGLGTLVLSIVVNVSTS